MRACAIGTALFVSGCAMAPLPVPSGSIAVVNAIDAATLPPLAVGSFVPAAELPAGSDRSLDLRAMVMRPEGGSFARYLGETLANQLHASGTLDPFSHLVVSGELVLNHASTAVGTGHAELAARFRLARGEELLFQKTLTAEQQWDSSFIAAAAVPAAEQSYSSLYVTLIGKLIADPDFRAAVMR